jgi:Protein of unknown function (DUF3795)
MATIMSACGVLCSGCPAHLGKARGPAHQRRTAAAWRRIYGLREKAENITCGGCLAPDDEVFHTSRRCRARLCCMSKSLTSCADCNMRRCPDLRRAQSVWDGVPKLAKTLSKADFAVYALPYCGHRRRLTAARSRRT